MLIIKNILAYFTTNFRRKFNDIWGIICPVCSGPLKEENFLGAIVCPHCNTKLKQKV